MLDCGTEAWGDSVERVRDGDTDEVAGSRGLEGPRGEQDEEMLVLGDSLDPEYGEKEDGDGRTEQRKAAGADMTSWLAGRVALPKPVVVLGLLGVRVMEERMVRGKGEAEEGLWRVKMGELTLDEDGEDLLVPFAWSCARLSFRLID